MQPPHLTVSVNAKKESDKEYILRIAQRCNHLTENLVDKDGLRKDKRRSESLAGSQNRTGLLGSTAADGAPGGAESMTGAARFKHHDIGFRGLELDDDLKMGKRSFNVNSVTRKLARHEAADQDRKGSTIGDQNRYDLFTGKPKNGYGGSLSTNGRRSMLPPSKDFLSNGHGQAEYRDSFGASPRVFHRQNGDFTHFQGLKVANSFLSSKNFSAKMSSSLFN